MVTVAFIWCFSCFSWFSYCRGNCICAGQGNTVVSHFVVQRGDFTVAIACVPCGTWRSLIYAWAWGFWVCWKLSAAEKVKSDCCRMPAVVSTLLTPLPVSCPLTTPLHYNFITLTDLGTEAYTSLQAHMMVGQTQGRYILYIIIIIIILEIPITKSFICTYCYSIIYCPTSTLKIPTLLHF